MKNLSYFIASLKIQKGEVDTSNDQLYLQRFVDCLKKLRSLGLLDSCMKSVQIYMQPVGCGCDGPEVVNPNPNAACYAPCPDIATNTQHALDYTASTVGSQGMGGYRWAYLPRDYVSYMRIGTFCNGKLINFDMNDDIAIQPGVPGLTGPCNPGQISKIIANCCSNAGENGYLGFSAQYPMFGQPWSYSYTVGSYAVGPGFYHGGYKILKDRNIIVFDPCVPLDWFVLEYMGDFMNDMGNALVPVGIEDHFILQYWVQYMDKLFTDKPEAVVMAAYNRWFGAVRDWNSNRNAFNIHQWVQLVRSFCYQGVKS